MTYGLALLLIMIAGTTAGALSWLASRLVAVELRRHFHDSGGVMFVQVSTLLSVLVAFIFSGVWTEYRIAEGSISSERAALHGTAMVAQGLPVPERTRLISGIAAYTRAVAKDEWPLMATRQRSAVAATRLKELVTMVDGPDGTVTDSTMRAQILNQLVQAHKARETCLFQLDESMSAAAWVTLLSIFTFPICLNVLAGIETRMLVALSSCLAASTTAVRVLVRMLDYPFKGALAIGNNDFVRLTKQLIAMTGNVSGSRADLCRPVITFANASAIRTNLGTADALSTLLAANIAIKLKATDLMVPAYTVCH